MLQQISYYLIFGKPLILWLGVITILSFLLTAAIPVLGQGRILKIPFVWHARMAGLSLSLAVIHGMLAIAAYW